MKPPLSPTHGTSLGTTAGITAVIAVVITVAVLAQCAQPLGPSGNLAAIAMSALMLGSVSLYSARNQIGHALDIAPSDPHTSGIVAARGLCGFHLGMAGVFAGSGLAASFHVRIAEATLGWFVPLVTLTMTGLALARAISWAAEVRRRSAVRPPVAESEASLS